MTHQESPAGRKWATGQPAKIVKLEDGREGALGKCRSCEAAVVFITNEKTGKRPPYDLDGKSHFASCPQSDYWKGRTSR